MTSLDTRRRHRRLASWLSAGVAAGCLLIGTAQAQDTAAAPIDLAACPWMDTSLSADQRAQLLLGASSLDQKMRWLNEHAANSPREIDFRGITYPEQVACTPSVLYANGPEGIHGTKGATAWPTPVSVAATWNLDLARKRGEAMAVQAFNSGVSVLLGPGMSSGRTPLLGRTAEYLGEDPLLSGRMAAATVNGMENDRPDMAVLANLKHYVGNEQELDRRVSSSNIDERTLQEVYDLPFRIAIEESDPASIMCSYNQINGVYACENPLLDLNLNARAGFRGYVMSDFNAVHSTAEALKAGLDQELNRPIFFTPELFHKALDAGEITEADIDDAALRVVRAYIEHGLFDNARPEKKVVPAASAEDGQLAREIATQSMVLLKNDGVLPLAATDVGTIAIIGPNAAASPYNGVSAQASCAANFRGTLVVDCSNIVDPLSAFAQRVVKAGGNVVFVDGSDLEAAKSAAATADVAIVFGFFTMGEFDDVPGLSLSHDGDALVEAVAEENGHTIVVLQTGTAVEMPWLDKVEGVVQAWYAGEAAGPALAGLFFGDANFSGRLPMTFPSSVAATPLKTPAQYPGVLAGDSTERAADDTTSIRQVDYSEGLATGYKWYQDNQAPLFAFGYGLSYSSFAYSELQATSAPKDGAIVAELSFVIENTSDVDGIAVPQIYLGFPASADEPGKRLVAFDQIAVAAGQKQTVTLRFSTDAGARPFQVWDPASGAWTVVVGTYTLGLGHSAQDIPLIQTLDIQN